MLPQAIWQDCDVRKRTLKKMYAEFAAQTTILLYQSDLLNE